MNTILVHMVKASVYIAGFYIVHLIFLSRDTLYRRNRNFILLSVVSALILPFFTIETSKPIMPLFSRMLSEIFVTGSPYDSSVLLTDKSSIQGSSWISATYLTGVFIFGIKFLIDLLELIFLIKKHKKKGSRIIRIQGFNTSGFSAFGHIFINEKLSPDEAYEIIRHEGNHLSHHHSLDIIFMELVKILQWFNPAIYMFTRSLRAVHEYQADEECINLGTTVKNYQRLLMNQLFRSRIFTISNSFSNPSLIKKRMIMMTKKRSRALANLKLLMVLPVIAVVMIFISSCSQNNNSPGDKTEIAPPPPPPPPPAQPVAEDNKGSVPFEVVDEMPVFKGGETALLKYIGNNTRYPDSAKVKGIQGKVIVRFAVEADGSIDKVTILKGVDPDLDKEAFRVVSELPDFEKPAVKDGKNVAVWFAVPISFTLK